VPLIKQDEQKAWLIRKFDQTCSFESLFMKTEIPIYFRKGNERRVGKIQTVLFDGVIRVSQPTIFIAMIKDGIGPAKAFGCGMLSIAPV
jgi:CRISPR system Cascade subunit CasE